MRILQAHNIQLGFGGADLVLDREKDMLESHGHDVHRFSVDNRSLESMSNLRAGIKAIWNKEAADLLQADIIEFKPDVVHVHTPFPLMSPLVFRRARQLGCTVVQTCHGYRNFCASGLLLRQGKVCSKCSGLKLKWPAVVHRCYKNSLPASTSVAASLTFHTLLGTFSRDVDLYITLSNFTRRMLISEGIPENKVVIKPNFLANAQQAGAGDGGYALYVGRLEPEKGIRTLLDAWSRYKVPMPLHIVGDGSLKEEVIQHAGKHNNIIYLDFMNQAEVSQQLSAAAFVVLPSEWYEAFPLIFIESLAAGCPILASDIGNFSEYIQPQITGLLFRCGDSQDLARQAGALVSDALHLKAMRKDCRRQYEEHYSAEVNYPLLLQTYERAINMPKD